MDTKELLQSLSKTLDTVASTQRARSEELDAIRTVLIGVLAALSADPAQHERLARSIAGAIDGQVEPAARSGMPNDMLAREEQWMQRLLPEQLRQSVQKARRT